MNKTEYNKIIEAISNLKGEKLRQIARGGAMAGFGFGENPKVKVAHKTEDGKINFRYAAASKYAIHIDGFFRITH